MAASLWVIGPHVICVRGFAQQGTAWGMCILLAGIGVLRSLVHASWVRWFYLVAYSMRIAACHCVDCVLSWKETRAQSLYFNHSRVFVLTLKYGTASDGMAVANGCARAGSKLNQCLFIAPNATIAAWVCDLDGFWKAVIVFEI